MMRPSFLILPIVAALVAACQSAPRPSATTPLPAHMLACRGEASLDTLHTAGAGFQRAANQVISRAVS